MTTRPQFGTGIAVKDFDYYREWLSVAEDAGFDLLTTGDSQSLWAEPFVALAVAAEHTTEPRLAITVSNPVTRHPAVVASSCLALQQISGDRFVYGISSGDSALRNIGAKEATVAELGEYVEAVKALCRGEAATWRDTTFRTGWHEAPTRSGWRRRVLAPRSWPEGLPTGWSSRTASRPT